MKQVKRSNVEVAGIFCAKECRDIWLAESCLSSWSIDFTNFDAILR